MADFDCFCGAAFDNREQLVGHNVQAHGWTEDESRRRVTEKYPND